MHLDIEPGQIRIESRRKVIEDNRGVPFGEQAPHEIGADEPRATCDQDFHSRLPL